MSAARRVFLSCAPEDEALRAAFEKHLAPLERSGKAAVWHAGKVQPGDEAARVVEQQIGMADVILLLVTPDLLASHRLHDEEIQPALARRDAGARVVPVLVKPCAWGASALAKLEPLPRSRMPIMLWPHPDEGWAEVVNGLSEVVEQSHSASAIGAPENARWNRLSGGALQGASRAPRLALDIKTHSLLAQPTNLEGVWLNAESSSMHCVRVIEGNVRVSYCYAGLDRMTGEFYDCQYVTGTLFGRFRWIDDSVRGYVHVRFQTVRDATGGFWYEQDIPQRMKAEFFRLRESFPGMMPFRWVSAAVRRDTDVGRRVFHAAPLDRVSGAPGGAPQERGLMNTAKMTDAEIRDAGWQALIEKLGPAGALRFALQTERGFGDHAALRDELLGAASVDELVSQMRAAQKKGRPTTRKAKVRRAGTRRARPAA